MPAKPQPHENEYFQRIEANRRERLLAKISEKELEARKQKYWHRCGKCGGEMETRPYQEIEIEVCPDCGAVLLDPGELEILAEKQGDEPGGLRGLLGRLGL